MAVLVSDSFNRADSTTTLGATDSYAGGSTATWSKVGSSVYGINTNQAYQATNANDSPAYVDMTTQADNVRVSVDIAVNTGIYINGLSFRVQDASNYFRAYATTGNVKIDRVVSGSSTNLLSVNLTGISVPFTVSVELSGNNINCLINGVLKGSVTDTNLLTATKHGLYVGNGATPRLDNFKIESLASGTAYTASLSDSITSSETFTKALSKATSDTVTMSETFVKLLSKTVNDSASTTDSISKSASKTQSDAITTSDTLSKRLTVTIADTVTSSDSETSTQGKAANLSDSVMITDAISKALTRHITDAITAGDTNSHMITQSLLDALTLSDAVAVSKGKAILLSDSITVSDGISKAAILTKLESLVMSDAISQTKALHVQLYDVMVTSESFSKLIPNAPMLVGTISLIGDRTLFVYLVGTRELNINLKGGL